MSGLSEAERRTLTGVIQRTLRDGETGLDDGACNRAGWHISENLVPAVERILAARVASAAAENAALRARIDEVLEALDRVDMLRQRHRVQPSGDYVKRRTIVNDLDDAMGHPSPHRVRRRGVPRRRPMAEMETLAEALSNAGIYDEFDETPLACIAADAALSWLASVLADDATVEVVQGRLDDLNAEGWIVYPHPNTGEPMQGRVSPRYLAEASLAALSAHLTAPASEESTHD